MPLLLRMLPKLLVAGGRRKVVSFGSYLVEMGGGGRRRRRGRGERKLTTCRIHGRGSRVVHINLRLDLEENTIGPLICCSPCGRDVLSYGNGRRAVDHGHNFRLGDGADRLLYEILPEANNRRRCRRRATVAAGNVHRTRDGRRVYHCSSGKSMSATSASRNIHAASRVRRNFSTKRNVHTAIQGSCLEFGLHRSPASLRRIVEQSWQGVLNGSKPSRSRSCLSRGFEKERGCDGRSLCIHRVCVRLQYIRNGDGGRSKNDTGGGAGSGNSVCHRCRNSVYHRCRKSVCHRGCDSSRNRNHHEWLRDRDGRPNTRRVAQSSTGAPDCFYCLRKVGCGVFRMAGDVLHTLTTLTTRNLPQSRRCCSCYWDRPGSNGTAGDSEDEEAEQHCGVHLVVEERETERLDCMWVERRKSSMRTWETEIEHEGISARLYSVSAKSRETPCPLLWFDHML